MDWLWEFIKQYGIWAGLAAVVLWWLGMRAIPALARFFVKRLELIDARAEVASAALIKAMTDNALINQRTLTVLEDMNRNIAKNTEAIQRRSPPK